ncbi:MAG: hypothetical protein COB24_00545 [Hyphomicrobiales bacterium]|nr:MAG: hypothetical protein COB24_00545 [Hyphomicrobiales bacterium]
MTKNIEQFLEQYLAENGLTRRHSHVRYIPFLDADESVDDHFINLLAGKICAGFRLKRWYIEQGIKWSEPGHIIVMTDYYGVPRACAKIKHFETVLYKNMTEQLAMAIGYGDGSLKTWQQRSHHIISLDCVAANIKFNPDIELLITHFEMLFPNPNPA